jgi:hypothetical protein
MGDSGVWQGVAMDALKYHMGCHTRPLYALWWATPETASWLFQGWPACRAGSLRLSSALWTPYVVRLLKTNPTVGWR